jgi:hypothetical protein
MSANRRVGACTPTQHIVVRANDVLLVTTSSTLFPHTNNMSHNDTKEILAHNDANEILLVVGWFEPRENEGRVVHCMHDPIIEH